jgi:hypothetical protein
MEFIFHKYKLIYLIKQTKTFDITKLIRLGNIILKLWKKNINIRNLVGS